MKQQPAGIHLVAGADRGLPGAAYGPGLLVRAQARIRGRPLDRALADGEDPASSRVLTRRAAWLTSPKNRRSLGRSIDRLLEPRRKRLEASPAIQPHRRELAAARLQLARVAALLEVDEPVYAQGVARVQLLLTDGGSALYAPQWKGQLLTEVETILD